MSDFLCLLSFLWPKFRRLESGQQLTAPGIIVPNLVVVFTSEGLITDNLQPITSVPLQSLPETDVPLDREAELFVESDHLLVVRPDLQVDLGATGRPEDALRLEHELPPQAAALATRLHPEVVDPAPVAFVARHDSANYPPVVFRHQKELGVNLQLPDNVLARVVLRVDQATLFPEGDNGDLVVGDERANLQGSRGSGLFLGRSEFQPLNRAHGDSPFAFSARFKFPIFDGHQRGHFELPMT